jgi:hypothetical protein
MARLRQGAREGGWKVGAAPVRARHVLQVAEGRCREPAGTAGEGGAGAGEGVSVVDEDHVTVARERQGRRQLVQERVV